MNIQRFTISVENGDDELDSVTFTVTGEGALAWAKNEQSLAGSNWEGVGDTDPDFAYCSPSNWKGLKDEVEKELASYLESGEVEIDWSMYSEPEKDES